MLKVAVVGCGGMGTIHAEHYMRIPETELVAVCDLNEQVAIRLAERTQTPSYTSFIEMLEQAKPDVVSIAVPTYLHAPFIRLAAEKGVHIICEKPIALNSQEAEEAIGVCEQHGVRLFVGHVVRFFPQYTQLAERITQFGGKQGGVYHAKRAGSHPGLVQSWFKDTSQSGGVILDLMVHDIDYALGIFGEAVEVYAFNRVTDDLDYASVTFRFKSGVIAQLEAFWGYPGPFHTSCEFAGVGGIIRNDSKDAESLRVRRVVEGGGGDGSVEIPQSTLLQDPYYRELQHFISCISSGEKALVTEKDALIALRWAEAAVESARTRLPVRLEQEVRS
ncbi:putative oxidoreductase YcjS [compost metagenome]